MTDEHNYKTKFLKMLRAGELPITVGLQHVDIYHDDWCGVFKGKLCDCNPEIKVRGQGN